MKTAEELYNKILDDDEFKSFPDGLMCMGQFKKALADYKQSILGLVDEMIKENDRNIEQLGYKHSFEQRNVALSELKQKIQSL